MKRGVFGGLRKTLRLARILRPLVAPDRRLLLAGAGLSGLYVAFRVAQPWPLKWIIDGLTGQRVEWLDRLTDAAPLSLAVLSAVYVVIALGAALSEYGQRLVLAGLGNRVVHRFRGDLYAHVLRQSLGFHERREPGELLTRIIYDTARLRQGTNAILTRVFQNLFLFAATIAVLVWISIPLAGVVAVSGVLAIALMGRNARRIRRASRDSRRREGRLAALVSDTLLGIRELQTFRPEVTTDERFTRKNAKGLKQEQKVRRLAAALVFRVEFVLTITVAVVMWFGTSAVEAGRLTPGDLVLFISYAVALYRPYRQVARQAARMGRTFASADRLMKIMATEPAVANRPGATTAPMLDGAIDFDEVSVTSPRRRRGGRKRVLREVSFGVKAGERVAVVGPNGAGKSTILRLALRLADPVGGVVRLDGRDVRDYTIESIRRQMSVVFQGSVFFGLTVRDNIALGRSDATVEEVRDAARRARTSNFIEALELGYDTRVRQGGRLFSVGERQRIAVARALLTDGRIWLLDEPTTGLDPKMASDITDQLFQSTEGHTVLWITHDPTIIASFDRVLALRKGRVRFSGTPSEYQDWLMRAAPTVEPISLTGGNSV